jgi:hypothetical protein
MAVTINASTSAGLVMTSDLSGVLTLQQNGVSLPNGGVAPAFSAYQTVAQTLTNVTFSLVTFTTEEFDTNNNFASSTFTPTVAGYYQLNAQVNNSASTNLARQLVILYKNGVSYKIGTDLAPSSTTGSRGVFSSLVYANGTTDYFQIYCYVSGTGTLLTVDNATQDTWFNGCLIRGA